MARKLLIVMLAVMLVVGAAGCGEQEYQELDLQGAGDKTLELLQAGDYAGLTHLVHPEKGLRFSPYAFIDEANDLVFDQEAVKGLGEDKEMYTWGSYDGSGEPIELTYADYYAKFVMSHDFLTADQVAANEVHVWGNTTINIKEVYPDAEFVEYSFAGFDPQYEGIDWEALRLIFEQVDGRWYLVGISHDQWTI